MAWFEHIDFYAFSRGSFRKPARNLVETVQRKSQQLFPQAGAIAAEAISASRKMKISTSPRVSAVTVYLGDMLLFPLPRQSRV
jgi:hypothetical protein